MAQSLHEVLKAMYGFDTVERENPITASVGTSVTKILSNDPNRLMFVCYNLSANSLYISFENNPSSSKGFYLAPNGGSIILSWDKDFSLPGRAWHAVAGGAASTIFIVELLSR